MPAYKKTPKHSTKSAIGFRLRAIRKARGITARMLAKELEPPCKPSRISKIERGLLKPSIAYIEAFAKALDLSHPETAELRALTNLFLMDFDRWRLQDARDLPGAQQRIYELERHLQFLKVFQWVVVPGLLQTKRYAYNLLRLFGGVSEDILDKTVQGRMRRQEVLRGKRKRFTFIIAESALRAKYATPDVMLEQLSHLRAMFDLPNIVIKILPTTAHLRALPVNSFQILDDQLVLIETRHMVVPVWDNDELQRYINDFRILDETATNSTDLLENIIRKFENPTY